MNGYTHGFDAGGKPTLREFMDVCARAFGACFEMRDRGSEAQLIREVESEVPRMTKHLRDAQKELTEFENMSIADHRREYNEYLAEREKSQKSSNVSKEDMRLRIQSLRLQVTEWSPPIELAALRKFMLEQLKETEEWDCRVGSLYDSEPLTIEQHIENEGSWRKNNLERLREDLEKRIKVEASANRWLQLLHDELRDPTGVSRR